MDPETLATAEGVEALVWIREQLRNEPDLQAIPGLTNRIHWSLGPEDETYPFITMEVLDTNDRMGVGPLILWSDVLVLVRAVGNTGSVYALRPIANGIHTALHAKDGYTNDARIVTCVRERPHMMPPEVTDRGRFEFLGGEYRLRVRPLS